MCHSALPRTRRGSESMEPAQGTLPSAAARGHLPARSGPLQLAISAPSESRQMAIARGYRGRLMSAGCGNAKSRRALRTGSATALAKPGPVEPAEAATHQIDQTSGAIAAAITSNRKTTPMPIDSSPFGQPALRGSGGKGRWTLRGRDRCACQELLPGGTDSAHEHVKDRPGIGVNVDAQIEVAVIGESRKRSGHVARYRRDRESVEQLSARDVDRKLRTGQVGDEDVHEMLPPDEEPGQSCERQQHHEHL